MSSVLFSVEPLELRLKTPFRIAHGTSFVRTNALVRLGDGIGEGALPPYYPYDFEAVAGYVDGLDTSELLEKGLESGLSYLPFGPPPALAAVDMALHDHWARQLGEPLFSLWGLDPAQIPVSSVTLSIPDTLDEISGSVEPFTDFPILKLKLGTGSLERDEAIVRAVREVSDARICVDANGAWSVEDAARIVATMLDLDLLFVEQPIAACDPAPWKLLRRLLPVDAPPLIADESVLSADDVLSLSSSIDGINVKLAKAGGLSGARRLIELARACDLLVLLGCMVESSVAVTAAAHLAPLADFADLDGAFLLAEDPFEGVAFDQGRLSLPERPGIGAVARSS